MNETTMFANRDTLIALMVQVQGMTRDDATMIFDLGEHAFNQALETIDRITDTAPEHLQTGCKIAAYKAMILYSKQFEQQMNAKVADILKRAD